MATCSWWVGADDDDDEAAAEIRALQIIDYIRDPRGGEDDVLSACCRSICPYSDRFQISVHTCGVVLSVGTHGINTELDLFWPLRFWCMITFILV